MLPSDLSWFCPVSAPLCQAQPKTWFTAFVALKGIFQHGLCMAAILLIDRRYTTPKQKALTIIRILISICFGVWVYQRVQTMNWNLYTYEATFGLYQCYREAWLLRKDRRQSQSKPQSQSWSLEDAQQYLEDFRVRNIHLMRKVEGIMKNREGKHPAELRLELNKLRVEGNEDEIGTLKQLMSEDQGSENV